MLYSNAWFKMLSLNRTHDPAKNAVNKLRDTVLRWTTILNANSGEKNVYKRRVPDPIRPIFSTFPLNV